MRPKRPKVGDIVLVRWIDSGASGHGKPSEDRPVHLEISETMGRVVSLKKDTKLAVTNGTNCDTLILAMCSAGDEDDRSELAALWWPAVISVETLRRKR